MNTRSRGVFITQLFANWKHAPGPSESLEKHQESAYHKILGWQLSLCVFFKNFNFIFQLQKYN